MNKKIVVLVLSALEVTSAWALPVSKAEAEEVARRFFDIDKTELSHGLPSLRLVRSAVSTAPDSQNEEYFIFTSSEKAGFVVVSGEDSLTPIAAYSHEALVSDGKPIPSAMKAWLDAYGAYVRDVRAGRRSPNATSGEEQGEAVLPLLKVNWGQNAPFNELCPNNSPTGCVATSIAQIMRYYNWPEQGEGVIEFENEKIDLSSYKYAWDKMLDSYTYGLDGQGNPVPEFTEEQATAVATLMRDCGYAVGMDYGQYESSANTILLTNAIFKYFKYAPGRFYHRSLYSSKTWIELIRKELKEGRPLNYSGSTAYGSGHSFVCDGIDTNNFVHINWGWDGAYNGYFDIDILAPESIGTGGGDNTGYFMNQGILTGIRPRTSEDEGKLPIQMFDVENLQVSSYENVLVVSFKRIINNGYETRRIAPSIEWENGEVQALSFSGVLSDIRPGAFISGDDLSGTLNLTGKAPGTYRFRFVNQSNEGVEAFNLGDFADRGTVTIAPDGTVSATLDDADMSKGIELDDVQASVIYEQMAGELSVRFRNLGDKYYARENVFLALVPEAVDETVLTDYAPYVNTASYPGMGYFYAKSVEVYGGATVMVDFPVWKLSAGTYKVHFCLKDGGVYSPIAEKNLCKIEIKAKPDHEFVVLTEPLTFSPEKVTEKSSVWVSAKCSYLAINPYEGTFELWAVSNDASQPDEFKILESNEFYVEAGAEKEKVISGMTSVFENMPDGTYTAYLKYRVNGVMQRIEGEDNSCVFSVEDYSGVNNASERSVSAWANGRSLCVQGLEPGAVVEVFSLDGVALRSAKAGVGQQQMMLDGINAGICLVKVTFVDGSVTVCKVAAL